MSEQDSKSHEIANAYARWTGGLSSVVFAQGAEVLLSTPYMFPGGHDEAISVVLAVETSNLRLRDGGQIAGFLWSYGIELASREDAINRIQPILATTGIRLQDGEFLLDGPLSEANLLIHTFAAELSAIAAQMYSLRSYYGFAKTRCRASRAATLLKNEIRKTGVTVSRYSPSEGEPEKGRLYCHMPKPVSGLEHTFDFFIQNGRSYSVDCIDFAGMITGATARNKTFEAVAIHQNLGDKSNGWDYQVAYTEPNMGSKAMGGDPLEFLKDANVTLVDLGDAESRVKLARKLTSVASQGSLL